MAPHYGPTVGHMLPRGLLIANPMATSTSSGVRDVITHALGLEVDLEVVTTTHRGHAEQLAGETRGLDLLITLGGDGTINEAVNGMLNSGVPDPPMLATIPGGSANVMARALGFPNDAIEATGMILESLRTDSSHHIGLGNARFTPHETGEDRSHWFTINAGVGIDADVIASMETQRAAGRTASPTRYVRTAALEYFRDLGRGGHSPLSLQLPGEDPIEGLALVIVQNTAPWTFFGPFAINPCPRASFDLGLDAFALHSLGPLPAARFGLRMLRGSRGGEVPGQLTLLHDEAAFTILAERPTALQVDGDSMGHIDSVSFRYVPRALRIVG
jgi:diacylglycerol kinase family enzyme